MYNRSSYFSFRQNTETTSCRPLGKDRLMMNQTESQRSPRCGDPSLEFARNRSRTSVLLLRTYFWTHLNMIIDVFLHGIGTLRNSALQFKLIVLYNNGRLHNIIFWWRARNTSLHFTLTKSKGRFLMSVRLRNQPSPSILKLAGCLGLEIIKCYECISHYFQ